MLLEVVVEGVLPEPRGEYGVSKVFAGNGHLTAASPSDTGAFARDVRDGQCLACVQPWRGTQDFSRRSRIEARSFALLSMPSRSSATSLSLGASCVI